MKGLRVRFLGIACALVLAIAAGAMSVTFATYPGYPILNPSGPSDPNEVAAIKAVIDRAYWLDGIAARTFDVSQFATVYVNDPAVQLSSEGADFLARARAGHPDAPSSSGFLDYKLAFYGHWQVGAERLEQLQARAKAEGREVTATELQAIATGGQPPAPRRTDPMYQTRLRFDSVRIDGQRAEVVFDDGAVLQRMFLVKTPDGWKIAGRRIIQVHF